MPNIWVTGLDREQGREFSRLASELFERELGTPRASVYVFLRDAVLFRDGAEAALPTVIEVSWIRRPREHFAKAVAGLTRIVKENLGRSGSVQVELHEKWDDAAIDGESCADWAARNRR
jgi:phenylpyruvate tautomerase PptA (4-oxalocrotonate tautomerase family)